MNLASKIDLVRDSTMHDIAISMRVLAGMSISDMVTPRDIQRIVASGRAQDFFAVGDQIRVHNSLFGDIAFDILGFDVETLTDSSKKHSMTIQPHMVLGTAGLISMMFDAPEMTLATGNYKSSGIYYAASSAQASGYRLLTSGTDFANGTAIGDGIYVNSVRDSTGYIVKYGYNRWNFSNIRQWLNSDAAAGTWWKSVHNGDSKPGYGDTLAGFMSYFDEEFISCLAKAKKTTAKNTVCDGGGSETTDDYFFLLSKTEVGGTNENSISEGAAYPYYTAAVADAGNAGRIKKRMDSGSNYGWLLRTPDSTGTYQVRRVYTDGGCDDVSKANANYGICPACVIA